MFGFDDGGEIGGCTNGQRPDDRAGLGGISIEKGGDSKPSCRKTAVGGERSTEVADANNDHRPALRKAELTTDLATQVVDVVSDSAGAVGAQIAEVLADFRGIEAGKISELIRRNGGSLGCRQLEQRPMVPGQARDGCVWDATHFLRHDLHAKPLVHQFTSSADHRGLTRSDRRRPNGRVGRNLLVDDNGKVLTTALAIGAALVAFAFSASTFERWLIRRQPQDLSWSVSLLMFCVGAGALAYGATAGWNGITFRTFYAFGAIINVPFLAAGQLQLQLPRRYAAAIAWVVSLFCALAVGVVLASPFTGPVEGTELPRGKDVFPLGPRLLAAFGSGVSALIVFAGTIVGVIGIIKSRDRMTRALAARRAGGLGLLALGTATLSASGTLNARFGEMRAFAITLTAGVIFLFAGFLLTGTRTRNANRGTVRNGIGAEVVRP